MSRNEWLFKCFESILLEDLFYCSFKNKVKNKIDLVLIWGPCTSYQLQVMKIKPTRNQSRLNMQRGASNAELT